MDLSHLFKKRPERRELSIPLLPEGADGLRLMLAESQGTSYQYFLTLAEAVANKAIVIMQGDDAGQIYLTCPAEKVRCSEADLRRVLEYLDAKAWKDLSSAGIFYELQPIGGTIAGGMGGGLVVNGVWLHSKFCNLGIQERVEDFISGRSAELES